MAPRSQQPEAVVEPLRNRCRAEHADPSCGELECQRQSVEPEADARHVLRVLGVELEAGRRGGRPVDEERDGLVLEELVQRERPFGARDVERRDAEDDLSRHAQRLAARRHDRQLRRKPEQPVRESSRRGQDVLAVVQHQEQRSR